MSRLGRSEGRGDSPQEGQGDASQGPLILAVETSSRIGSVALAMGPRLLSQISFSAPLHHSMEIFPSINQLLDRFGCHPQDIRQVHIAVGPGSFTGLRIAVTMAKTMCLAGDVRIVTVDTLDTIAANVADASAMPVAEDSGAERRDSRLAVVLDAKRGQFFTAVYEWTDAADALIVDGPDADPGYEIPAPHYGFWHKVVPDCLIDAKQILERFAAPDRPLWLTGDGLLYHRDAFAGEYVRILDERLWSPAAARVHLLGRQKAQAGRFADPLALVPFYLRGPDVTLRKT
jgi:tRNA threonylcarbamoyl adenosine modification protein YeaZ